MIFFSLICKSTFAQTDVLRTAEKLFEKGEFYSAAILYEKYLSKNKVGLTQNSFKPYFIHQKEATNKNSNKIKSSHIAWKLAGSYRLINDYNAALKWYKMCFDNYNSIFPLSQYWYGVCLRANKDYSAAEESLKAFVAKNNGTNKYKEYAQKELKNLEFIRYQLKNNHRNSYELTKIENPINREAGCFAATIVDESMLLLTSTQTDSLALKQNKNPYRNRLFKTSLLNGQLDQMKPLIIEGTDGLMEQGAACFSASGNKMYFTQWQKNDNKSKTAIYYSIRENDQWGNPVKAELLNIDGYNSMQPYITSDGKYIFFSSDRPGGYGKYDLWYASMKDDKVISDPVNLGELINSTEDEKTPYYSSITKTLVFSSNGRIGYGGYDLFSAKESITAWEEPVNMGFPFNSSRDDIYFVSKGTGKNFEAYFSSDRESSCCLELYNVKNIKQDKKLTGLIVDCKTSMPLSECKIFISELNTGNIIDSLVTGISGRYDLDLGENDSLDLMISKAGYTLKEIKINPAAELPNDSFETDTFQAGRVCIEKLPDEDDIAKHKEAEEKEVTVYFDFDKSDIDVASKEKLDHVLSKLKNNLVLVIEIGGYTDEKGTDKYNLDLGYKRAKAAADYLIDQGIPGNRIRIKSYGKCCPVNPSEKNPDPGQLSRRIQFTFIAP